MTENPKGFKKFWFEDITCCDFKVRTSKAMYRIKDSIYREKGGCLGNSMEVDGNMKK